eukprot:11784446-Prorocentrum_lima.AAC.1
MDGTLGFIGAGNMAGSLMRGVVSAGVVSADRLSAADISGALLEKLQEDIPDVSVIRGGNAE